jgi:hypothetical protein
MAHKPTSRGGHSKSSNTGSARRQKAPAKHNAPGRRPACTALPPSPLSDPTPSGHSAASHVEDSREYTPINDDDQQDNDDDELDEAEYDLRDEEKGEDASGKRAAAAQLKRMQKRTKVECVCTYISCSLLIIPLVPLMARHCL